MNLLIDTTVAINQKPHSGIGYVGDLKENLPHGYGVCTYPNTFFHYEGEWNKGVKEGLGTLKMKDGGYYKGEFSNGEIDGHGVRYWAHTNNTYEGQFEQGEICGRGVMVYGNGDIYDGTWIDNIRQGEGTLTETDGSIYKGSFYKHKRHGDGKQKYSRGGIYEGSWIDNLRHGHGEMIYDDGSIYEGQWRVGEMHGQGSLTHTSQITYSGMWNHGRPEDEPVTLNIVGGNEEIALETCEMPFSLHIECPTVNGEVSSECGRFLQVTAGFHRIEKEKDKPTPSRLSNVSRNDVVSATQPLRFNESSLVPKEDGSDQVIGRRTTPFGYDVVPYPLYVKLVVNDPIDGEDRQSIPTPISREVSFKESTATDSPAIPKTPNKTFQDAIKVVNNVNKVVDNLNSVSYEFIPVTAQRTINGKVSFHNLILPSIESTHSAATPDGEVKTPPGRRKADSTSKSRDEAGSGGGKRKKPLKAKQEEKTEEVSPIGHYNPGNYVIIVEDITESPFLDIVLEPVFILVNVPQVSKKNKVPKSAVKPDR